MRWQIKCVTLTFVILVFGTAPDFVSTLANDHGTATLVVAGFDHKIVDEHKQLFDF